MATRHVEHVNRKDTIPGFIAWVTILLWFLLAIMAAGTAQAEENQTVILTASDILPDIEAALTERGMAAGAQIVLNEPAIPVSTGGDIDIAHVSYNGQSGRFVIRLQNSQAAIMGTAKTVTSFPVLTRYIERGEIIHETDIAYVESAEARAGMFVQDAADLIGMEARRPLRPQSPLRSSDVTAPVLIKKGALITLTYAIEGLRLSHQGVARSSPLKTSRAIAS
jgi:flagella basal body P-ring formation protein FlgA